MYIGQILPNVHGVPSNSNFALNPCRAKVQKPFCLIHIMHGPERNMLKKILLKISLVLKPVLGKIFISISLFHNNLNDNLWPLYDNIFNIKTASHYF